ncbi:hypothetical protein PA7559_02080 [Pseudoalteromonas distincta]
MYFPANASKKLTPEIKLNIVIFYKNDYLFNFIEKLDDYFEEIRKRDFISLIS